MNSMAAGFMKVNAQGAVVMDTNTYATTGSLGSYLALSGGTMTGAIVMSGTQQIRQAGFSGIEYYNGTAQWQGYIGTENNTGNLRYNSFNGTHTWYANGSQTMQLGSGGSLFLVGDTMQLSNGNFRWRHSGDWVYAGNSSGDYGGSMGVAAQKYWSQGDYYFGTRGVWLSAYLNQAVLTTSSPTFAGLTLNGSIINNNEGAVLMESNTSENNNWLWKEAVKQWGIFYFNRGSQSGQTIGTYSTIGAETFFMGGSSGIAMPSGWSGHQSGSLIAAMVSHWNGYIYSASTVFAATDIRSPRFFSTSSSGTMFSHGAMNDAFGYNGSYGTYIGSPVGGTYYLYANGTFFDNGTIRTLIHSGNISSYAVTSLTDTLNSVTSRGNTIGTNSIRFTNASGQGIRWDHSSWTNNAFVRMDGNFDLKIGGHSSISFITNQLNVGDAVRMSIDQGGTVSIAGTLNFTDTTTGINKSGGRLSMRSESTDNVANFAEYGLYLPRTGREAGLYVESPIEARGGLRIGSGAVSGTINVGADTGVVGSRLVQRDGNGYIYANHINFNTSESENPSISSFITSNGDGWSRKSSIAHVRNQLGNYGSWITGYTETDTFASVTGRGASTASQVSFTKTDDHAISVGTIRGRAVGSQGGEFIQLYERVNIGGPNGWGAANTGAPTFGLSVFGGATIGYGNNGGLTVNGNINAPSGYVSNGNPWGTSNSAFFPNGITTAGGTNWVYGLTYLGNAPANGSGAEVRANGSSYFRSNNASGTWGYAGQFVDRTSAANNYVPWSFENELGNHSWGIVARFHIQTAGQDKPSIQFTSAGSNERWSLGYCTGTDFNFRITQNHGHRTDGSGNSDGWGTERFRINTDGTTLLGIQGSNTNVYGLLRLASNNHLYLDNNFGQSIVGLYSASRYQGVFAMGDAYKLSIDGTSTGSLYGMAWSHPNAGGVASNLNTHGLLVMENGTFLAAISGSIRARDDVRAPAMFVNGNAVIHAGNIGSQSVSYASSAGSVSWGNVSNKPQEWLNTTNLIEGNAPNTAVPSGFYQDIGGAGNPTGSWFNYINVRHSNPGNVHGYQLGMSYYDNELRFRSYQGSGTYQSWAIALSSQNFTSYVNAPNAVGNGNGYYNVQNWLQVNGSHGIFWPGHYSFHIRPNITSSHTQMEIIGSKNSYGGIYDNHSAVNGFMYDGGGNGGVYREANGRWYWYYNLGNACMGVNTSSTSSSYAMYVNGNVFATGDITAYSDARKKTNITTIDKALETVTKMRGVFYDKIGEESKGRQLGVIAQEVNQILPEAVTYAADVDEYGVKYGNIVGVLIEAIKEQQLQIEKLQNKLDNVLSSR
jgi:hypothetical protein